MNKTMIGAVIALATLSGCVQPTMYNWGGYSNSMYAFYREPKTEHAFTTTLSEIITVNEQAGTKVPPGIYAEYGYMLMSAGQSAEAVALFNKEATAWPESKPFMETMINLASGKQPNGKTGSKENGTGAIDVDLMKKGG